MELNLSAVIIFVKDVEKIKAFYGNTFGLDIIEEIPEEWVVLKAGDCNIALHKIGAAHINEIPEAPGTDNNIKLVFETENDIHEFREKLLQLSVPVTEIKSFAGYNYLLCDGQDPEGNTFQLKQKKQ